MLLLDRWEWSWLATFSWLPVGKLFVFSVWNVKTCPLLHLFVWLYLFLCKTNYPLNVSLTLPSLPGLVVASALIDVSQQKPSDFKDKSQALKNRKALPPAHQGTCVWLNLSIHRSPFCAVWGHIGPTRRRSQLEASFQRRDMAARRFFSFGCYHSPPPLFVLQEHEFRWAHFMFSLWFEPLEIFHGLLQQATTGPQLLFFIFLLEQQSVLV